MKQEIVKIDIEGKVLGSCICTFYNNGKADVMIIDSVEVEPDHRREGIGTKLVEKAIGLARENNVDSIELNVNKDNIAAISLYEKLGFTKTNKDYYRIIL